MGNRYSKTRAFFSTVDQGRQNKAQDSLAQGKALTGVANAKTQASVDQSKQTQGTIKQTNVQTQTPAFRAVTQGDASVGMNTPVVASPAPQAAPTPVATQIASENLVKRDVAGEIANKESEKVALAARKNQTGLDDQNAINAAQDKGGQLIQDYSQDYDKKKMGELGASSEFEQEAAGIRNLLATAPENQNVGILSQLYKNYDPRFGALDSNILQGDINDLRAGAKESVDNEKRAGRMSDMTREAYFREADGIKKRLEEAKGQDASERSRRQSQYDDAIGLRDADIGTLKSIQAEQDTEKGRLVSTAGDMAKKLTRMEDTPEFQSLQQRENSALALLRSSKKRAGSKQRAESARADQELKQIALEKNALKMKAELQQEVTVKNLQKLVSQGLLSRDQALSLISGSNSYSNRPQDVTKLFDKYGVNK